MGSAAVKRPENGGRQLFSFARLPGLRPQAFVAGLLAHRLDRETQVLAAVRDGCTSIGQIVLRLYADVDQRLHQPAARSVLAHLGKLADEGRIVVVPAGPARLDSAFLAV